MPKTITRAQEKNQHKTTSLADKACLLFTDLQEAFTLDQNTGKMNTHKD